MLHESTTKSFNTFAFLSTTLSLEIAESYCKNSDSVIYKITIPSDFPYLVLDESNLQILLPIATQVKVTYKCPTKIKEHYIYEANIDNSQANIMLNNVKSILDIPQVSIIPIIQNIENIENLEENYRLSKKRLRLGGSSSLYLYNKINYDKGGGPVRNKPIKESKEVIRNLYIIKDVLKKRDMNKEVKKDDYVIRRIINEILASLIYNKVYNCKTFDYFLVKGQICKSPGVNYFIGSEYDDTITYNLNNHVKQVLNGFIVDCIMSNWDVYNNNNIGIKENKEVIRTDVGGALAYRGVGDFKVSFFNNYTNLQDHKTFFTDTRNKSGDILRGLYNSLLETEKKEFGDIIYKKVYEVITIEFITIEFIKQKLIEIKTEELKTYLDVFKNPEYEDYINQIIELVVKRHNWYIQNKTQVIEAILVEIKKPLSLQGGKNDLYIKYNGYIRKVNIKNKLKYIIINKEKINLKDIKGKYKYIQKAGGCNVTTELDTKCNYIDPPKTNMNDIININNDPLMQIYKIKCKLEKAKPRNARKNLGKY
jgi:hypothetical protein